MRKALATLAVALLIPTYAVGQVELGTRGFGLTVLSGGGTVSNISVPGGGILSAPTVYLMAFPSTNLMVGPELSFNLLSGGGSTLTLLGLAGWIGYLFTPGPTSAYIAGNVALQSVSSSGSSNTELGVGGVVGYRAVVIPNIAVGVEGGVRRWLDASITEVVISLKLGLVFP